MHKFWFCHPDIIFSPNGTASHKSYHLFFFIVIFNSVSLLNMNLGEKKIPYKNIIKGLYIFRNFFYFWTGDVHFCLFFVHFGDGSCLPLVIFSIVNGEARAMNSCAKALLNGDLALSLFSSIFICCLVNAQILHSQPLFFSMVIITHSVTLKIILLSREHLFFLISIEELAHLNYTM
jgi:hypothetical protein